jgi:hypothetical protein
LPIEASLIFGVKAGGALFAGTFLVVMLGFSGATNDTLLRLRELPFLSVLLFLALLEVGLGFAAFLQKGPAGWILLASADCEFLRHVPALAVSFTIVALSTPCGWRAINFKLKPRPHFGPPFASRWLEFICFF